MKKVFTIGISMTIIIFILFTGYQSSAVQEKDERVQQKVKEEAQKALEDREWNDYKTDSEIKIIDNEARIAQVRKKMNRSGKAIDPVYEKGLDTLEIKNKELEVRLNVYEKELRSSELLKNEFNNDMDEIDQSLNDLNFKTTLYLIRNH